MQLNSHPISMHYLNYSENKSVIVEFSEILSEKEYSDIKNKYFNGFKVKKEYKNLKFEMIIEYDGVSSDGPESYLYDLFVTWNNNGKSYLENWHKEHWYNSNKHEDFVSNGIRILT